MWKDCVVKWGKSGRNVEREWVDKISDCVGGISSEIKIVWGWNLDSVVLKSDCVVLISDCVGGLVYRSAPSSPPDTIWTTVLKKYSDTIWTTI
jgi:hypothetical protein